jgi:hypothetical protein|nr:MAG TPA: hypothetical protein [Bacteriophage sp.]
MCGRYSIKERDVIEKKLKEAYTKFLIGVILYGT